MIRTLALAGLIALPVAVWGLPTRAHNAPSGWAYDGSCCSTRDCMPIPTEAVTTAPDGYRVELPPGLHPFAPGGISLLIPYDSPKLRPSGDNLYHLCITPAGGVPCLYQPPQGF
jgi:hypothetical protein